MGDPSPADLMGRGSYVGLRESWIESTPAIPRLYMRFLQCFVSAALEQAKRERGDKVWFQK
jgi:hypothetical protein